MTTGFQIAGAVVRAWVRLYTAGMPGDLRDARRAEIDADLWDHQNDVGNEGTSVGTWALLLMRAALGARDDLTWRFDALRERRIAVMTLSSKAIRWMGLGGLSGGVVWAGRYVVPLDPGTAVRGYGHIGLAVLLIAGLVAFYAQQRTRVNRVGRAGFILVLMSFVAWLALNVLGTAFRISDDSSLMDLLGLVFVLPLAPGFFLLGIGSTGVARAIPLAIGCAFIAFLLIPTALLAQYFPSVTNWNRGDSPMGVAAFFLMGVGLALMGYSVVRNVASSPQR